MFSTQHEASWHLSKNGKHKQHANLSWQMNQCYHWVREDFLWLEELLIEVQFRSSLVVEYTLCFKTPYCELWRHDELWFTLINLPSTLRSTKSFIVTDHEFIKMHFMHNSKENIWLTQPSCLLSNTMACIRWPPILKSLPSKWWIMQENGYMGSQNKWISNGKYKKKSSPSSRCNPFSLRSISGKIRAVNWECQNNTQMIGSQQPKGAGKNSFSCTPSR